MTRLSLSVWIFCFTAATPALLPNTARAELYICIDHGRLAVRQQPSGSCTELLVPTTRRGGGRDSGTVEKPPRRENRGADAASVVYVQTRLAELGYRPGPADGVVGRRTRSAIRAFQHDAALAVTGRADAALIDALKNAR